MSEETPPTPKKYEGPYAHLRRSPQPTRPSLRWLSPWRIYALGTIAALGVTAFYLLKLTFTPDLIKAAGMDPAAPPPPPRNTLSAWCLSGTMQRVPPAPFCTPARSPGCRHGQTLQITYTSPVRSQEWVYPVLLGADLRPLDLALRSRRIRPGATDTPLVQWRVEARRERSPAALVGVFSRQPLSAVELRPWLEAWRTRERLLSRPPRLPQGLRAKGATLSAYKICLGK